MKKYLLILSLLYSFTASGDTLKVFVIGKNAELVNFLKKQSYSVEVLDPTDAVDRNMLSTQKWQGAHLATWIPEHQKMSFSLYRFLKDKDYDVIFFPEHNGYGYYLTEAKKQGYGFEKTILVGYVTEPAEWLWDIANVIVPDIPSYLQAESEQKSVEQADIAIVPSSFAYKVLRDKGWKFPSTTKILYPLYEPINNSKVQENLPNSEIKEIVFIAPSDFRHGYDLFMKTIKKAYDLQPENMKGIKITILHKEPMKGKSIDSTQPEELTNINHVSNVNYIEYIKDPSRLVVFTSREELGSYDEYIALHEGVRFIGMDDGFLEEIIKNTNIIAPHLNTSALAKKLLDELAHSTTTPKPKKSLQKVVHEWENAIEEIKKRVTQPVPQSPLATPFVSVCITHFNRPEQLMEALNGFDKQTYKNFEVIVMDDGSKPDVINHLKQEIEPFMQKRGWRIFYQENQFISKARNNLVNYAKGPLLLLFEDDDTPLPDTIERFVRIKQRTKADIVNTNLGLASKNKFHADELWLTPGSHVTSISGENHIGYSAIALMSKDIFEKVGGYFDSYGFVYSDYEFYTRAGLKNAKIVTSLEPAYIYNFVGQDHHVYEAHRAQFYQTRIVLSAYKHGLPKKFRNIPFWLYSVVQDNERLTKENKELRGQMSSHLKNDKPIK